MAFWSNYLRRTDATSVRQADGQKGNYRVLVTSLTLAVVAGACLYLGWYLLAAPQVAP